MRRTIPATVTLPERARWALAAVENELAEFEARAPKLKIQCQIRCVPKALGRGNLKVSGPSQL